MPGASVGGARWPPVRPGRRRGRGRGGVDRRAGPRRLLGRVAAGLRGCTGNGQALAVRAARDGPVPLAWAGGIRGAEPRRTGPHDGGRREAPAADVAVAWQPAIDEARFAGDIARILAHISAGDTYQVNYTFPLAGTVSARPMGVVPCSCAPGEGAVLPPASTSAAAVVMSLSPELFIERRGDARAGTTHEGHDPARSLAGGGRTAVAGVGRQREGARRERDDRRPAAQRHRSRRANRIGARLGALRARALSDRVATHVADRRHARPATSLWDLLRAVFPCGSVTGAPKVRTMEIIADARIVAARPVHRRGVPAAARAAT